jgi:hypothetical protein
VDYSCSNEEEDKDGIIGPLYWDGRSLIN